MRKFVSATILGLLAPLSANAADVTICSITRNPNGFDHQTVTLQGVPTSVKETTSRRGNDYSTFMLQGREGCVLKIFTWGHPALNAANRVRVEGEYTIKHHQGRYTFYNELQATKVTPTSQ